MIQTTIILGAGASCIYDFPTGEQLMTEIKDLLATDIQKNLDIVEKLKETTHDSIDSFLNSYPNYNKTVKSAIARILYRRENPNIFFQLKNKDNLYRILFKQIPPDSYHRYKIISFNYDRSFKWYFIKALMVDYKLTLGEAHKKLENLEIEHIHGRLSDLPGEDKNPLFKLGSIPYGYIYSGKLGEDRSDPIAQNNFYNYVERYGMDNFRTVYEGDTKNERARHFIESSQRIIFLGFGYHDLNMKILGCDFSKPFPDKVIVGTAFEIQPIPKKVIENKFPGIDKLYLNTCADVFQNYICLENPDLDEMPYKIKKEAYEKFGRPE